MKKILLIFPLLLIIGCGYTPLYSSKDSNYKVISFKKNINNNLTNYIQDSISMLSNDSAENVLKIDFNYSEDIIVILKDSKGDPKKNRLTINVNLELFNAEDNIISSKRFVENFEYSIDDNKFNLKQYEKNLKFSLIEQISQQIIEFLTNVK